MHTNDYTLGPELKSVIALYYIITKNIILPVKSDLAKVSLRIRNKIMNIYIYIYCTLMDLCDVQLIYWIYTWNELESLDIGKFCFSLFSSVVVGLEILLLTKSA